jgi:hypothetical protein
MSHVQSHNDRIPKICPFRNVRYPPLADIRSAFDDARMVSTGKNELIATLRARHKDALEHLRKARDDGDRAQTRAWEAAFKRISTFKYQAGDDLNAPIW